MNTNFNAESAALALTPTTVSKPGRTDNFAAAQKAAQDLESVFISEMLKEMFAGISTDEEFGGGPGEDVFRSLTIDEYGKQIAAGGGIGLAKSVLKELLAAQERAS